MLIRTSITYGYMEKNKFHQKQGREKCEVVCIFDNGSIKGYCNADDLSIKNEIQTQIDLHDNQLNGVSHKSQY